MLKAAFKHITPHHAPLLAMLARLSNAQLSERIYHAGFAQFRSLPEATSQRRFA
jgi:hypothetical protein